MGRLVIPEADAWFLPDTAGVSYQRAHAKTSIAIQAIDVAARQLGYFHNASYHELAGDDFDGVFRLGKHAAPDGTLAPYTEIAKFGLVPLSDAALAAHARAAVDTWLARRPATNPIERHHARFAARDLAWLRAEAPERFHEYAFATFRQVGACFELAGSFLAWLGERGDPAAAAAVPACATIASTAKAVQFKLARAVTLGRDVDFDTPFAAMAGAWDEVMLRLDARRAARNHARRGA
jgi:hypothetical protein